MAGKIFGVIILYYPEQGVYKNIQSYLPILDGLIIVDNSESPFEIELKKFNISTFLIQDKCNKGIAARLNEAAMIAIENNAEWLLTMDQDSLFSTENISAYKNCFENFLAKDEVAMFGVEYEVESKEKSCLSIETDMLITSGSLVHLGIMQQIGGFDENLFIDEVDSEYCFRAVVNGFRTIRLQNIYLEHTLGKTSSHISLKSFKQTNRVLHSPIRVYYMIRNYLYVSNKYKRKLPGSFPQRKAAILNRIKNNLLYGKDRMKLIHYIFMAYNDYKKGNMGKLN